MDTGFEHQLWSTCRTLCGIDEAGRGPLAGPVVAAAVVFPRWFVAKGSALEGINDSKKLRAGEREALAEAIREKAEAIGIAVVDHETIDRVNIYTATMLAMNRAVESLPAPPDFLVVDGNSFRPHLPIPYQAITGGDGRVFSIAAASIVAKTTRDAIMTRYGNDFPQYGFARHFGYATPEHVKAIAAFGRCPIHRKSFRLAKLGEK